MFVLYFLLALGATLIGSMTGMGGGIIMKPVMDALSHFDTASISMLSSITVFSMSAVSCLRRFIPKKKGEKSAPSQSAPMLKTVLLAAGSLVGGYLGQLVFDALGKSGEGVKIAQNAVTLVLVALIFFYMLFKEKAPCLHLTSAPVYVILGILMGAVSSFLGIGGGPVNVALLSFVMGMDMKSAVFASLLSVLFTQTSKLITVALTAGFSEFDLSMLPFMVVAGITGATVGSLISRKISDKSSKYLFCATQILIFSLCLYNIFS